MGSGISIFLVSLISPGQHVTCHAGRAGLKFVSVLLLLPPKLGLQSINCLSGGCGQFYMKPENKRHS